MKNSQPKKVHTLYQKKLAIGAKILSQKICLCFQVLYRNKLTTLACEKELFTLRISPYYINSNMLFRISQRTNMRFIAAAAKGPFLLVNLDTTTSTLEDVSAFIQKFHSSLVFFGVLYSNVFYTATRLAAHHISRQQLLPLLLNSYLILIILLRTKIFKLASFNFR